MSSTREEEIGGYRLVQILAVLIGAGACAAAVVMSRKGGLVYLDYVKDPFGRDVMVGTWIGIPTALAGAVCAYIGGQDRPWDWIRLAATLTLTANLLVPAAWLVMALMKAGIIGF
ncbi:MAG: hypothetical protein RIR91_686 [Verrucomicrobiota bacterium]|jgi:hypothetical protein